MKPVMKRLLLVLLAVGLGNGLYHAYKPLPPGIDPYDTWEDRSAVRSLQAWIGEHLGWSSF